MSSSIPGLNLISHPEAEDQYKQVVVKEDSDPEMVGPFEDEKPTTVETPNEPEEPTNAVEDDPNQAENDNTVNEENVIVSESKEGAEDISEEQDITEENSKVEEPKDEKRESEIPQTGIDAIDRALANDKMEFSSDSSDSSDSEETDGESSDSSSSESDSDEEPNNIAYDELSGDEAAPSSPLMTKNEVLDEPAPKLPENFILEESTPIEPIGELSQVVERRAIIQASKSAEFRVLQDGDSVFCFGDRRVIGVLYETFGRVQAPIYAVKFDSEEEAKELFSRKGETVYYVVPATKFILTATARVKGSDASNIHDEEIPEEEQEFSDDEREMESKASKKKKRSRPRKQKDPSSARPQHRPRFNHEVANRPDYDNPAHNGYNRTNAPQYYQHQQQQNMPFNMPMQMQMQMSMPMQPPSMQFMNQWPQFGGQYGMPVPFMPHPQPYQNPNAGQQQQAPRRPYDSNAGLSYDDDEYKP
ncbi:hypothetical protein TRVA0_018S00760 [Trichomonascus vanleenenianus]|uniref:RNA-binding snoRNP assembly protein n=1 Tax=Trichomonascus vanleenenianus TaxID=2268995 RepID=UPI003ECAF686